MYKGCNDQGGILCFCLVHFRKTFSADLLHHLFGHYTIISSGLGIFPAGCFLSGPDHCKKIFFCDPALRAVFTDGPSLFDQFLKFHIFPPYLSGAGFASGSCSYSGTDLYVHTFYGTILTQCRIEINFQNSGIVTVHSVLSNTLQKILPENNNCNTTYEDFF